VSAVGMRRLPCPRCGGILTAGWWRRGRGASPRCGVAAGRGWRGDRTMRAGRGNGDAGLWSSPSGAPYHPHGRADALGARSVAFPAIATGVYGFPPYQAAKIAVETIRSTPPAVERVRLIAFDESARDVLYAALRQ